MSVVFLESKILRGLDWILILIHQINHFDIYQNN